MLFALNDWLILSCTSEVGVPETRLRMAVPAFDIDCVNRAAVSQSAQHGFSCHSVTHGEMV